MIEKVNMRHLCSIRFALGPICSSKKEEEKSQQPLRKIILKRGLPTACLSCQQTSWLNISRGSKNQCNV